MQKKWEDLHIKARQNSLSRDEQQLFKKWTQAIDFLQTNPRHPGLQTHEIKPLSKSYGIKVFQSYLENRKPRAMRMYWVYAPPSKTEKYITIIGLEPHPDSKNASYNFVDLSNLPDM